MKRYLIVLISSFVVACTNQVAPAPRDSPSTRKSAATRPTTEETSGETRPTSQPGSAPAASQPVTAPAAPYAAVRDVPWMNITYEIPDPVLPHGPMRAVTFKDGAAKIDHGPDGVETWSITEVIYGDLTGDGVEEATVILVYNGGGSGYFSQAPVFWLSGGKPGRIGIIPGGDRGAGGFESITIKDGAALVRRYWLKKDEGACCPSQVRLETWRWEDNQMKEKKGKRRLWAL